MSFCWWVNSRVIYACLRLHSVTPYCFRKVVVGCFKQTMWLSSFCSHSTSVQSQTMATSGFRSDRWTWILYFMVFVCFSHPERLLMRVWMGTLFMHFCRVLCLTYSWGEKRHCFLNLKLFKEWAETPLSLGCVVTCVCSWVWRSELQISLQIPFVFPLRKIIQSHGGGFHWSVWILMRVRTDFFF